ncbi:MAG: hypothetical protein WBK55_03685 [Alphaproteobacteria bacterium]
MIAKGSHFSEYCGTRNLKTGKGFTAMLRLSGLGLAGKGEVRDYTLDNIDYFLDAENPHSPEYTESDIELLKYAHKQLEFAIEADEASKKDSPKIGGLWTPGGNLGRGEQQETQPVPTPTGMS